MDCKRIRIERNGGTLTLPIVTETRITRMRRRLRKMEIVKTFLGVMIFMSWPLIALTLPLSPMGRRRE